MLSKIVKITVNIRIFTTNRNFHNCDKKIYYSVSNYYPFLPVNPH